VEAAVIAYKFLQQDGTSVFTGFQWPLPDGGPGAWVVDARVDPCRSGIHACRPSDLPYWVGRVLYEIELETQIVEQPTKIVAARARLLRPVEAWDDELRDTYTRMCADRAHSLLGFVAARIAEEVSGTEAYHAERAHQTEWLVSRLGLQT
jgi:hypothetical protein